MTPKITPARSLAGETPASRSNCRIPRWICAVALLVAIALVGGRFALPWYRHQTVKEHVEAFGGRVVCRAPPGWLVSVVGTQIAGSFCNRVVAVRLDMTPACDADFQMVCNLAEIESLNLVTGNISPAALRALRPLTELRELTLSGRILSDENILELRHLRKLQILRIEGDTALSLTGAESLKEHIPGLSIYW